MHPMLQEACCADQRQGEGESRRRAHVGAPLETANKEDAAEQNEKRDHDGDFERDRAKSIACGDRCKSDQSYGVGGEACPQGNLEPPEPRAKQGIEEGGGQHGGAEMEGRPPIRMMHSAHGEAGEDPPDGRREGLE